MNRIGLFLIALCLFCETQAQRFGIEEDTVILEMMSHDVSKNSEALTIHAYTSEKIDLGFRVILKENLHSSWDVGVQTQQITYPPSTESGPIGTLDSSSEILIYLYPDSKSGEGLLAIEVYNPDSISEKDTVYFILRVVQSASVPEPVRSLTVYPNPCSDDLILGGGDVYDLVELYSISGEFLWMAYGVQRVSMHDLEPGLYCVRLLLDRRWYFVKVLKE